MMYGVYIYTIQHGVFGIPILGWLKRSQCRHYICIFFTIYIYRVFGLVETHFVLFV